MTSKEAIKIIKYRTEDEPAIMGDDIYDMFDLIEKDLEVLELIKNSLIRTIKPIKLEQYDPKQNNFIDYVARQEITYQTNKLKKEEQELLREWVINNIGLGTILSWIKNKGEAK